MDVIRYIFEFMVAFVVTYAFISIIVGALL